MKTLGKIVLGFTALIVGVCAIGLMGNTSTAIPANAEGTYTSVNGTNIRVIQQGQGQDVLLIHGLPGSLEDWESITSELAKDFRVTVYDRSGHGYSEFAPELNNLNSNTDIALGLINNLNLKDVIVVGHSYGGAICANMASRNPDSVSAFVSVAGVSLSRPEKVKGIYKIMSVPVLGAGIAVIGNQTVGRSMMDEGIPIAFSPNQDVMPSDFIEKRVPMWLTVKNSLATALEQITMPGDVGEVDLKSIEHPFYILQGDSDLSIPVPHGEKFKEEIKNSELTVLKNTGHFIQYAEPAVLIDTIKKAAQHH